METTNNTEAQPKDSAAQIPLQRLVMPVSDEDFDFYGDWLSGIAVDKFIGGYYGKPYTHICYNGDLIDAELVKFTDYSQGVMIGENQGPVDEV